MNLDKYLLSDDIEMVQLGVNLFFSQNGTGKIPTINERFAIRTNKDKKEFTVVDLFGLTDLWAMHQRVDMPLYKMADFTEGISIDNDTWTYKIT